MPINHYLRTFRTRVDSILDGFLIFVGALSIIFGVIRYGFYAPEWVSAIILFVSKVLIALFVSQEFVRFFFIKDLVQHLRARLFEIVITLISLFYLFEIHKVEQLLAVFHPEAKSIDFILLYLAVSQFFILLKIITQKVRKLRGFERIGLNPSQVFIASFLIPILIGTLFLKLPKASIDGISWVDALFTATSAVCVTGLTVLSTETSFTGFGKIIICVLFQIGGLGMMTLTVFFSKFLSGHLGVGESALVSNWLSIQKLGRVGSLLSQIFVFTIVIEIIGAAFLYVSSGHSFYSFQVFAFYDALFHSISAFCNAGFTLNPSALNTSNVMQNTSYANAIMLLIVVGGLGFPVISNLWSWLQFKTGLLNKTSFRLSIHTKLVLVCTGVLTVLGAVVIYITEKSASFQNLSFFEGLYHSLFYSVTARTAGFNIWPTDTLSSVTAFVLILLMWIGASPSSTGGGIKNVTLVVVFLDIIATLRGRSKVTLFQREIDTSSIKKAFCVLILSLILLCLSVFIMIFMEPHMNRVDLVFEVFSAWATVGLSRGITADLSEATKIFISFLMIVGRVGIFSVLISIFKRREQPNYSLPKEAIIIH